MRRCPWHEGRTCEQYTAEVAAREEQEMQQMLETNRFRRCPRCRHGIQKTEGCDHMTCEYVPTRITAVTDATSYVLHFLHKSIRIA